jgi:hypothetical protein
MPNEKSRKGGNEGQKTIEERSLTTSDGRKSKRQRKGIKSDF